MIRYRKEGGFAGVLEELQVEEDGAAHFQRSISGTPQFDIKGQLESNTVRELARLAEEADIRSVDRETNEQRPPFDAFTYQVIYGRANSERTLEVQRINEAPKEVQQLITKLETVARDLMAR